MPNAKLTPEQEDIQRKRKARLFVEEQAGQFAETLDLEGWKLKDLPGNLGKCKMMTELNGSRNLLAEIRPWIGEALGNVRVLQLQCNKITLLPEELGMLVHLEHLDLSVNQLGDITGDVGRAFGLLGNLKYLDLSQNRIQEVPYNFGNLVNLEKLYLSRNNVTTLPEELCKLERLQELRLCHNKLSDLPSHFGELQELRQLSLIYNQFVELPVQVCKLVNLEELFLNGNFLSVLPSAIGFMVGLHRLYVRENRLYRLPRTIGALTNLEELSLARNHLTSLSAEIGLLTNLRQLSASENQIASIPHQIGQLKNLESLFVQNNELSDVPVELVDAENLRRLHVQNNNITFLPPELDKLDELEILDAGENKFSNSLTLPSWFLGCSLSSTSLRNIDIVQLVVLGVFVAASVVPADALSRPMRQMIFQGMLTIFLLIQLLLPLFILVSKKMRVFKGSWYPTGLVRPVDWLKGPNMVVAVELLVESLQLSAYAFLDDLGWPRWISTVFNVFLLDLLQPNGELGFSTAVADQVQYYRFVGRLALGVVYCLAARMMLELTQRNIPFVRRHLGSFFAFISFGSRILFLPLISILFSALACTFVPGSPPILDYTPRQGEYSITCWRWDLGVPPHWTYALPAIVTMWLFYPYAVLSVPVWQQRAGESDLDIRFKPSYMVFVSICKFFIAMNANFFSADRMQLLVVLTVTNFLMAGVTLGFKVSTHPYVSVWRAFFMACSGISCGVGLMQLRSVNPNGTRLSESAAGMTIPYTAVIDVALFWVLLFPVAIFLSTRRHKKFMEVFEEKLLEYNVEQQVLEREQVEENRRLLKEAVRPSFSSAPGFLKKLGSAKGEDVDGAEVDVVAVDVDVEEVEGEEDGGAGVGKAGGDGRGGGEEEEEVEEEEEDEELLQPAHVPAGAMKFEWNRLKKLVVKGKAVEKMAEEDEKDKEDETAIMEVREEEEEGGGEE